MPPIACEVPGRVVEIGRASPRTDVERSVRLQFRRADRELARATLGLLRQEYGGTDGIRLRSPPVLRPARGPCLDRATASKSMLPSTTSWPLPDRLEWAEQMSQPVQR